jgi:uncharacterized protein (TIGR02594 family)
MSALSPAALSSAALSRIPARFGFLRDAPRPLWLDRAIEMLGQAEVPGAASNPEILKLRREAGTPFPGEDGVVPWCAIFINAILARAGLPGTGNAMARGFVSDRKNFRVVERPAIGAIVVLSSPSRGATAGHVGFYAGEDGLFVHLLGGNQDDEVSIAAFRKDRLVGIVWPRSAALPPAPWDGPRRLPPPGRKAVRPVRDD